MRDAHIKYAHVLTGGARGAILDDEAMRTVLRAETLGWVHLDGTHADSAGWIASHLDYLDPQAIEALLDPASRPRITPLGDGLMIILRVINFNEGEDPEDMVSLRVWIDAHRIVTVSLRRVRAVERMSDALSAGIGPQTAGQFLTRLIEDVTGKIADFQSDLDVQAEALEDKIVRDESDGLRSDVVNLRLQVIAARRFMAPQRDVIHAIALSQCSFIDEETRREIEEEAQKMTRVIEDLDELRDQAIVLREELSGQLSDRLNRNMFVLSMISAVFLPLGFLTGLFGVNVGGMPGLASNAAFFWLCASLVGVVAVQAGAVFWMRRTRRPSR
ncbi:zinc transporter ZntB [Celeribacter marinus]|nr:zinc transporter ZntB [Celeribacter marinus]SFK19273.1 zinc transporter [Celeribacter marinus]